jgi:hypothetical protein
MQIESHSSGQTASEDNVVDERGALAPLAVSAHEHLSGKSPLPFIGAQKFNRIFKNWSDI